jgi:hypothetical protein
MRSSAMKISLSGWRAELVLALALAAFLLALPALALWWAHVVAVWVLELADA